MNHKEAKEALLPHAGEQGVAEILIEEEHTIKLAMREKDRMVKNDDWRRQPHHPRMEWMPIMPQLTLDWVVSTEIVRRLQAEGFEAKVLINPSSLNYEDTRVMLRDPLMRDDREYPWEEPDEAV